MAKNKRWIQNPKLAQFDKFSIPVTDSRDNNDYQITQAELTQVVNAANVTAGALTAGAKIGGEDIATKKNTLFGTAGTLKNGDDFNNFLTNGVYFSPRDGLNLINKPTQPTGGKLIVESLINETSKGYIKQTWVPVTVNGTWVRKYSIDSGKWWDWEKEATTESTVKKAEELLPTPYSLGDLNAPMKSGFYIGSSMKHAPDIYGFTVININYLETAGTQLAIRAEVRGLQRVFYRRKENNIWEESWHEIAVVDGFVKKADYLNSHSWSEKSANDIEETGVYFGYSLGTLPTVGGYNIFHQAYAGVSYATQLATGVENNMILWRRKTKDKWDKWAQIQTAPVTALQAYNEGITKEV